MFCSCDFCKKLRSSGNEREFRTRSQVLIDGDLSVDFPPEAYVHSLPHNIDLSALKYLLVTHSHMDHFYAHDFILRGYKYGKLEESSLRIYGNGEVLKVFSECTAREMKGEVAEHIKLNLLNPYDEIEFDEYRVIALPACHGGGEQALLFYIEKQGKGYLHLYDTGALKDECVEYLAKRGKKIDLVAFDCTFLDAPKSIELRRHMCIEDNMEIMAKLQERGLVHDGTKYVITHFSHNSKPTIEKLAEIEKKYSVIAAYDGLTVEI